MDIGQTLSVKLEFGNRLSRQGSAKDIRAKVAVALNRLSKSGHLLQSGITNEDLREDLYVATNDSEALFVHTFDSSYVEITWFLRGQPAVALSQLADVQEDLDEYQPKIALTTFNGVKINLRAKICSGN